MLLRRGGLRRERHVCYYGLALMSISRDEVRRIAELARLELDEPTLEALRADLARILDYVAELDTVDVSAVEPTFHAPPIDARLRPILPSTPLLREEVLAAAPRHEEGAFAVPRILEGS
ncbi:MAG: Asp-tRNA(Asn)/Glu-tRNA(Gln) amidotransferase subunit GatC [Myxococcota bacterium]|nr:Asp-tRNA(Asn)/Glu-tRNA(Gln) amidotransferase subunit GatC [Myxococcota bacterium]MDW8361442.1 Asp-tRNA(Asn)/Glu-tRNA(Gln) amidotransferase subunit GatC [Myxococcales bacterium]